MAVVWVHIDALDAEHPVMSRSERAVFVWDAADMERRGWSLKRCLFVHECVAEMGVEVVAGRAEDVLREIGGPVFAADTPDPALRAVMEAVGAEAVPGKPFSSLPPGTDMGRFFRYWNQAKRSAMTHSFNQ